MFIFKKFIFCLIISFSLFAFVSIFHRDGLGNESKKGEKMESVKIDGKKLFEQLIAKATKAIDAMKKKDYKELYNLGCINLKREVSLKQFINYHKDQDKKFAKKGDEIKDIQLITDEKEFLKENGFKTLDEILSQRQIASIYFRNIWLMNMDDKDRKMEVKIRLGESFRFENGDWFFAPSPVRYEGF